MHALLVHQLAGPHDALDSEAVAAPRAGGATVAAEIGDGSGRPASGGGALLGGTRPHRLLRGALQRL